MPVAICHEVELLSDNRVDLCLLVKCQPCFDDEQTSSLPIPALPDHTCSHMLTADCLSLPQSPSEVPGCLLATGASTDIREQLAYHHARLGAQIVITTRREYMHYTRSVLLRMCLMQFVTCCALPFTHPSLFSTIFLSLWNHLLGLLAIVIIITNSNTSNC